jgi:ATP-dependent Clp protease ATP-binding subunit ClpB
MKGVINDVIASKGEIILFIDEIHTLVGAGQAEGTFILDFYDIGILILSRYFFPSQNQAVWMHRTCSSLPLLVENSTLSVPPHRTSTENTLVRCVFILVASSLVSFGAFNRFCFSEKDGALARRFQPVYVDEPSVEETISILRGLKAKYEIHHGAS